jgi:hypothetical protein
LSPFLCPPLPLPPPPPPDGAPPPSSQTDDPTPTAENSASPSPTEPTGSTWITTIPDGFPLGSGWPDPSESEYGDEALEGPSRDLEPFDLVACGNRVPDPGSPDRLNARWRNVEDLRARELRTFVSEQEAVTYLAHLRVLWDTCPTQEGEDQYTRVRSLRTTSQGDESFALVTAYDFQGAPAVGLTIEQVIRVGNAVLIDETSNEGGAGSDRDEEVARHIRAMTGASAPVVEAMEVFAAATGDGLTEADLVTLDRVPARDRLGAWRQTELADAPTLACQPERLAVLGADAMVAREFRANIAGSPASEPPSSAVNTAVLQFADESAASAAYETVAGWIEDCSAPESGLEPHKDDEFVQPAVEGGRGEWRLRTFLAPDVCTDCDAARFHRMGVAQVGDRLALVELAEVGGPLEPELLERTMSELFAEVVSAARP